MSTFNLRTSVSRPSWLQVISLAIGAVALHENNENFTAVAALKLQGGRSDQYKQPKLHDSMVEFWQLERKRMMWVNWVQGVQPNGDAILKWRQFEDLNGPEWEYAYNGDRVAVVPYWGSVRGQPYQSAIEWNLRNPWMEQAFDYSDKPPQSVGGSDNSRMFVKYMGNLGIVLETIYDEEEIGTNESRATLSPGWYYILYVENKPESTAENNWDLQYNVREEFTLKMVPRGDSDLSFFTQASNRIVSKRYVKFGARHYKLKELISYQIFFRSSESREKYRFTRLLTIVSLARQIMPIIMKNPGVLVQEYDDWLPLGHGRAQVQKVYGEGYKCTQYQSGEGLQLQGGKGETGHLLDIKDVTAFEAGKLVDVMNSANGMKDNAERLQKLKSTPSKLGDEDRVVVHYFKRGHHDYDRQWTIARESTKNVRLTGTFATKEAVEVLLRNARGGRVGAWFMSQLARLRA